MIRTENWCGYDIRFVEINGEWWAILKDICDALRLRPAAVSQRLNPDMLERVPVEITRESVRPFRYKNDDHVSNDVVKSTSTVYMHRFLNSPRHGQDLPFDKWRYMYGGVKTTKRYEY